MCVCGGNGKFGNFMKAVGLTVNARDYTLLENIVLGFQLKLCARDDEMAFRQLWQQLGLHQPHGAHYRRAHGTQTISKRKSGRVKMQDVGRHPDINARLGGGRGFQKSDQRRHTPIISIGAAIII
jgi:hypothetical protein